MKKVYIKTYGCQMNVYDSQRMVELLAPLGYTPTESPEGAHIAIVNTCHIREKSEEKLYSDLGRLRRHKNHQKASGEDMMLVVAGCVAQAHGEEVFRQAPYVDMVVGPQSYQKLPQMIAQATRLADLSKSGGHLKPGLGILDVDFPAESKFDDLPSPQAQGEVSAFLSIQEGCDKFCHYCVVPYTRGAEYSRPTASILQDAQSLLKSGAREIYLLGQNVNAYHGFSEGKGSDLGNLIRAIASLEGVERIRYTTSHPSDVTDSQIQIHKECEKLMPFLHLPVQSGSSRILKMMNRQHTKEDYLQTIEKFREARPDIAFSSDFIVGYPGETDKDFEETLALVREVEYAQAYTFKYSPRPGTPAALEENQVPENVKEERLQALQDVMIDLQKSYNQKSIGKVIPVLLDKKGQRTGQLKGKTPHGQSVYVNVSERLYGHIIDVKIESATANSLTGEIVGLL